MNLVKVFRHKKKVSIKNRLEQFGINPDDFSHDDFRTVNITFFDRMIGVLKKSEGMYHDSNAFFEFIKMEDFNDGSREIILTSFHNGEQGIKVIIDELYASLGEDKYFRTTFSNNDQNDIRHSHRDFSLRFWEGDDFNVELFVGRQEGLIQLTILSK